MPYINERIRKSIIVLEVQFFFWSCMIIFLYQEET